MLPSSPLASRGLLILKRWMPARSARRSVGVWLGWFWVMGGFGLAAADLGLRVTAGGFELKGRPFRGVGVNYYDAFVRSLKAFPEAPSRQAFAELKARGIPFARFSAGGYWPVEWGLYRTNRAEHFSRLEAVVRLAEEHQVGLIPSLFWHLPTVPDLVGEPVSAWGDPSSRTTAFMREYVLEVVRRFRDSPAIWGWEFGNEYNLPADLPNAAEHRPAVVPGLGTPPSRTERDEITHVQFRMAMLEFARAVRKEDPHRALFSGNAFPRPSAWHQMRDRSWTRDSDAEWASMLEGDNPDPINTLTGRLYAPDDDTALARAMGVAARIGKPLFVGEFGVPGTPDETSIAAFQSMLDRLDRHRVSLAALWVYDFEGQEADWNVTAFNARKAQLDAIAALHRRWQVEAP